MVLKPAPGRAQRRGITREPLKKSRDALQARAVAQLVEEMMPHLRATQAPSPAAPTP